MKTIYVFKGHSFSAIEYYKDILSGKNSISGMAEEFAYSALSEIFRGNTATKPPIQQQIEFMVFNANNLLKDIREYELKKSKEKKIKKLMKN